MAQTKLEVSMSRGSDPARLRAANTPERASEAKRDGDSIRSIAHDFNNLIGVINGYVELLTMSALDDAQRRHVGAIRGAAEQTGQLSQQLQECAAALDARGARTENVGVQELNRDTFDLASTYVCLGAQGGTASRIDVTPAFWDTIDARRDLRDGRLVALFHHDADWDHWEMHPNGEELLVLVSGAMDLVLDKGGVQRVVELSSGRAFIVPRGTWHRALVRAPGALLAITAGRGTQHRPVQ
jgi:mannose-6-phosphate isomerase-like protein (cupin superfamily)